VTKKELEEKVRLLEERIAILEARPIYVPTYIPNPLPYNPENPYWAPVMYKTSAGTKLEPL
jgi:hypothetical protein